MNTSSVRILLVDPPSWLSVQLQDADGGFAFDIDTDTTIAITKQIDEANTVAAIKQDTVRNFTLPTTEKNAAFIGDYGNPNAFNFYHEKPIKVKIFVGLYELPENKIIVRGSGDQPYEVEAFGDANIWISALAGMAIADLGFGLSPTFDWDWINDLHQNKYKYIDGNLPVFLPYANYGKRRYKNAVSVEDFRVWHSLLYILKTAFCKIGWVFNCPILETDLGRRLWVYILAEDFATRSAGTNKGFNAIVDSVALSVPNFNFLPLNGVIVFDNDSVAPAYDNGGFYDNSTGQYQGSSMSGDFHAIVQITGTSVVVPGFISEYTLYLEKHNLSLSQYVLLDFFDSGEVATGTYKTTLSAYNVQLDADEIMVVRAVTNAAFPCVVDQYESKFWNIPKAVIIGEGDIIDLSVIVDPNLKVLDILKGFAHIVNLKHETNPNSKVVSFYPEDGGIFYNEGKQEAFFRSNAEALNWTDKVKCESLKIDFNLSKNKRNVLLEFKSDGGDYKAKNTGFKNPLHSKAIDFGDSFKPGQPEKYTNPFFAPTFNGFDFDVRVIFGGTTPDSSPYMPIIWKADIDSNGVLPEQTTKIEPRIILTKKTQRLLIPVYKENAFPTSGDIWVKDSFYPVGFGATAYHAPASQIWPEGFRALTQIGDINVPMYDECIVYGTDEYAKNLPGSYEQFYYQALKRLYTTVPLEFLINISFLDFINFSPRDKIYIQYFSKKLGDISFYSRVSSLTDFVLNKDIVTPALLQPDSNHLTMACCSCVVFVEGPFFNAPTVDFNALMVGNCGEIYSFEWTLTNIDFAANINIDGDNNMQIVKIGGNVSPSLWHFIIEVSVVTECGTVTASYEYAYETP